MLRCASGAAPRGHVPVYVDPLVDYKGDGVLWCHLHADSVDELHAFATRLGMKRSWFQDKPFFPHYDLQWRKRALAVRLGAIEISHRDMAKRSLAARGVIIKDRK